MFVYAIFFLFLIVGALFVPSKSKYLHAYIYCIGIALWLITGLRDASVGADTDSYIKHFLSSKSVNIDVAINSREPLYYCLTWCLAQVFNDYVVYLLFWALFPYLAFCYISKRELVSSNEAVISVFLIFALGFFSFYVAGIRQTAAMSICFYSWLFLQNGKPVQFVITVVIASLLHNSAILFLLAYPLSHFHTKWYHIIFLPFIFVFSQFIQISHITSATSFIFDERFHSYGTTYRSSLNASGLIMQLCLLSFCFTKKRQLEKYPHTDLLFTLALAGAFFQSLSGLLAEMARVSMYFSISLILLVPITFRQYSLHSKKIIYVCFLCACLVYLFLLSSANLPKYKLV